jgi:hypothetical protein
VRGVLLRASTLVGPDSRELLAAAAATMCCLLPPSPPSLPQELSMWIYSLALLCITPSPTWCAAYVETSFGRLTAPDTSPQVCVCV